jgi:hypothetical protein
LAIGTNVLVDEFRFARQNADALSVEPVLAFVAANVESVEEEEELESTGDHLESAAIHKIYENLLRLIIRRSAKAEKLLRVFGLLALLAHKVRHVLRSFLGDSHALAVEPVVAQVAANVESKQEPMSPQLLAIKSTSNSL